MSRIEAHHIFQFASLLIVIGLLCSRFMISLGMIFFLIAGIWEGNILLKIKAFFNNKYYLAVSGIFLIFFISGIWSEDSQYFLNRMRIKLPILFLPFAFCAIPQLDIKIIKRVMWGFILAILISTFWSLGMFILDADHYVSIYSKGQIIPTPIHHIRFSIMISLACCLSIYLYLKSAKFEVEKIEKRSLVLIAVFLILYLHFLAVRSGLFTLYVLLICLFYFLLKEKANKTLSISIAAVVVFMVFLSTQYVPTIKNKIGYMKYSLELFSQNKNIRDLSDSRRLGSIYAGLQLIKNNPVAGVGIGDIMNETNTYLSENYPELKDLELLPHNQYILTAAAIGIPGLLLFVLFTIMPLLYYNGYNDYFFFSSQIMFFASFLVEHTIESQIGVALYIFVLLFAMKTQESLNTAKG